MNNIKGFVIKAVFFILAFYLAQFISQFAFGFLTGMGGNVKIVGLSSVAFDPLITIAYVVMYYFITLFYQPHPKVQYFLFLLTLFLSFTVNFIQGSVFLVAFYFLLDKLRIL